MNKDLRLFLYYIGLVGSFMTMFIIAKILSLILVALLTA